MSRDYNPYQLPISAAAVPMSGVAVAIAIGIVLQRYGASWGIAVILAVCALIIYVILDSGKPGSGFRLKAEKYHWCWVILFFCGVGIMCSTFHSPPANEIVTAPGFPYIRGVVKDVKEQASGDVVTIDVHSLNDGRGKRLDSPDFTLISNVDAINLHRGDVVECRASILPRDSVKPLEANRAFFTERRLKESDVRVIDHDRRLQFRALDMRDRIIVIIDNSGLSRESKDFLSGVLLGDKRAVKPDTRAAYSRAGIAHVLAVSGLHTGIVAAIMLMLTLPLAIIGLRKTRYIFAIAGVWCFAFLCGLETPVVRAAIMVTFVMVGAATGRRNQPLNALFAAAALILLCNPDALFQISFQLSFLVTGAILVFGTLWRNSPLRQRRPILFSLQQYLFLSLTAFLAGAMLCGVYFHSIPLLFLPLNLLIVPVLPAVFVIGGIYIAAQALGFEFRLAANIIDFIVSVITDSAEWIGSLEFGVLEVTISPTVAWCYLAAMLMFALWVLQRKRWLLTAGAASMCLTAIAAGIGI